jgi:hypothetical protein
LEKSLSIAATVVAAALTGGCSSPAGPTNPGSGVLGVLVACPSSVLVGQQSGCIATANLADGDRPDVNVSAVWSSSDPAIATLGPIGSFTAQAVGQVVISATYQGYKGSASVTVQFHDAVEIDAFTQQGAMTLGSTVTLTVLGFYCVASSATGQFGLTMTDQNGSVLGTAGPNTVSQGGRDFNLPITFTIPPGTTEACLAAGLQIGQSTLTSPSWPATPGTLPGPCLRVSH